MLSEEKMKQQMQLYIDGFNNNDLATLVGLFADDATVEDPVGGSLLLKGKAEIEPFYAKALGMNIKVKLAAPIRASHGNSAAMAFDVDLVLPTGPVCIRTIDVMTFNEQGFFTSMRAYWGMSDMQMR